MPAEWVMVRIRKDIHARLLREIDLLDKAREQGHVQFADCQDGISLSWMIERCLQEREDRRERNRRNRQKKSKRGPGKARRKEVKEAM